MIVRDAGLAVRAGEAPILSGIDHVGVVVRDLAAEVAAWRGQGFQVSDPVPLLAEVAGVQRPLGQQSAHVIFENAYVELSAPDPGADNHLVPYLAAAGEGVRILVHRAADIAAAHAASPDAPPPRLSARRVTLPEGQHTAQFAWFPLATPTLPDLLSAVVTHHTPQVVFHPALCRHPNGCARLDHFLGAVRARGGRGRRGGAGPSCGGGGCGAAADHRHGACANGRGRVRDAGVPHFGLIVLYTSIRFAGPSQPRLRPTCLPDLPALPACPT